MNFLVRLILLFLLAVLISNCRTPGLSQAEMKLLEEEKNEINEHEQLLKQQRKQHLNNQNKEIRKMMHRSEKYSRKLRRAKRNCRF